MRRLLIALLVILLPFVVATVGLVAQPPTLSSAGGTQDVAVVQATIVATGIPGAGAITEIGTFQRGGPFVEKPAFAVATQPGQVLDPKRLLVASTSNFGAPLALPQAEGSVLSIDVSGAAPVVVPAEFASAGGQVSAAGGAVILYAAQSPAFLNGIKNPGAVTNGLPSVSLPLGISLNAGFGRVWFANSPNGAGSDGTISVIDPNGAPLAGAPDPVAGGVFAGNETNRNTATTHGLTAGALATALLTKSPDASGRAVFLAALADGSVVQVHVAKGVDGLVPAGTFTPLASVASDGVESNDPSVITRVGMLFNWVPTRIAFVSDPLANRILAIDLSDDGTSFSAAGVRYLASPVLHAPIDLAPAVREGAARNFASNTTLGGGSDIYVLNRGDNSIVRLTQTGDVVAIRQVTADLDGFRVSGIAVSEDSRTIWIAATGPDRQGIVMKIPAFGSGVVTTSLLNQSSSGVVAQGTDIFSHNLTPAELVGPLFNGQACSSCHNTPFPGGMGTDASTFVTRVARIHNGVFDPLLAHGGPIARQQSIVNLGVPCGLPTGVPPQANVTSVRSAPTLRGMALIDDVILSDIQAVQAAEPEALRGRLNVLDDGRIGRFGWKAQTSTLVEFIGQAFRDEIGSTSPLAPKDLVNGCGASILKPEADAVPATSVAAFLNTLDPPIPLAATLSSPGAGLFASVGCAACHNPSYRVLGTTANPSGQILTAFLYSDLLLHDMGPGLADGFLQGSSTGSEFRTAPLWRVSDRSHFLHDGRAATILDAILAHGGQAADVVARFQALSTADQQALLAFLNGI